MGTIRSVLVGALLCLYGDGGLAADLIPVQQFAQLPQNQQMALSPDGEYIAFISPLEGREYLVAHHVKGLGYGKPFLMPPIKDAEIYWFRWVNATRLIAGYRFFDRIGGTIEVTQTRLLAADRDGGNVINAVKPSRADKDRSVKISTTRAARAQIQDNLVSILADDPDHILIAIDDNYDGDTDIRLVDVNTGDFKTIERGQQGVRQWLADANGVPRLATGVIGIRETMMYRSSEGKWIKAEETEWYKKGYRPEAFTSDPEVVLVSGPTPHGTSGLYSFDLRTGAVVDTLFENERYDLGGILHAPGSDRVIGHYYIGDKPERVFTDPEWAQMQQRVDRELPDTDNDIVSVTGDGNLYLVQAESASSPPAYWVLDVGGGGRYPLAESYPGLKPADMAPVRTVQYPARDGTMIPAYLTLPNGREAKNLPIVVMPHGGPQSRDYLNFDYLAQFIASRGYGVLQPNFRGSTGYGKAWEKAGFQEWGGLMQDDVTDGTEWLIDQGIADPGRICIVGWSYGGYAALMGAVKTPALYRCAASINGVADLARLAAEDKQYIGGRIWTKSYGADRSDLKQRSPTQNIDQITAPILLIAAKDDARVPYGHARDMASAMKRAKKSAKFVLLEQGGHALVNGEARLKALEEIETFLAEQLGRVE